jgi:hypothetical protein
VTLTPNEFVVIPSLNIDFIFSFIFTKVLHFQ